MAVTKVDLRNELVAAREGIEKFSDKANRITTAMAGKDNLKEKPLYRLLDSRFKTELRFGKTMTISSLLPVTKSPRRSWAPKLQLPSECTLPGVWQSMSFGLSL